MFLIKKENPYIFKGLGNYTPNVTLVNWADQTAVKFENKRASTV